jgi:protein-arginine kinase activator protein McsA
VKRRRVVEVDETCQRCGSSAIVRLADVGRLSLLYWVCQRCAQENATAWDAELREAVPCEVGFFG